MQICWRPLLLVIFVPTRHLLTESIFVADPPFPGSRIGVVSILLSFRPFLPCVEIESEILACDGLERLETVGCGA